MATLKVINMAVTPTTGECWDTFLNALKFNFPAFAMYKPQTQEFFFTEGLTSDDEILIQTYIDNFTCAEGVKDESDLNVISADGVQSINKGEDPTIFENLEIGTMWANIVSGDLFLCLDATTDKNIWSGIKSHKFIRPIPPANKFDFFDDDSTLAMYEMNDNAKDVGGLYDGKADDIIYDTGLEGQCARSAKKGTISIKDLPIDETTSAVTIAGWINWNGKSSVMPFGFNTYSLYSYRGNLGFYTKGSDLMGFNFTEYENKWVYIIASFKKGAVGAIYLNGVAEDLIQLKGTFDTSDALFSKNFNIFGYANSKSYREFGSIERLRIINRELDSNEALLLSQAETNFIQNLGGVA